MNAANTPMTRYCDWWENHHKTVCNKSSFTKTSIFVPLESKSWGVLMNEFNMLKFNLESTASGLGYKRCLNFQVNIGAKKNTGFVWQKGNWKWKSWEQNKSKLHHTEYKVINKQTQNRYKVKCDEEVVWVEDVLLNRLVCNQSSSRWNKH